MNTPGKGNGYGSRFHAYGNTLSSDSVCRCVVCLDTACETAVSYTHLLDRAMKNRCLHRRGFTSEVCVCWERTGTP